MDEDEVIIQVINRSIQTLRDAQETQAEAIASLAESLQALRDYHSREVIRSVVENIHGDAPF